MDKQSAVILPFAIILIGLLIFLIGLLASFFGMDSYYHLIHSFNKEKGNQTINDIVSLTARYEKNPQRLNEIAYLITDDFTDMFWESQRNDKFFCYYKDTNGNDMWVWCPPLYGILDKDPTHYEYTVDKLGRVRVMKTNDLAFDPTWVASQKTGGCEAISVFFNETANRSGFVTHIVRSDGVFNTGHIWNEVLIDGEWKFFDIQKYGEIRYRKNKTTSNSSIWFGNRSDYGESSGAGLCDTTKFGVYVFDQRTNGYGENITQYYDPLNKCPHGVHK